MKKTEIRITELQKEILWGLMLGDGHLRFYGKNSAFLFSQSESHKDYLFYVYQLFSSLCLSPPKERTHTVRKIRGLSIKPRKSKHWRFLTVALPELNLYYQAFYREKKKCIPELIKDSLTPRGLAFWYADDGSMKSKSSKGCILNTHSFTQEECALLCQTLQERFQLNCWPRPQKTPTGKIQHQIYISGWSYNRFKDLIFPFLHPSMHYKFPLPRKAGRGFWREQKCLKSNGSARR